MRTSQKDNMLRNYTAKTCKTSKTKPFKTGKTQYAEEAK